MPDVPRVTVRDPRDAGRRGDLLEQGAERERRPLPRRVKALAAVGIVVLGLGGLVVRVAVRDRTEKSVRQAAFAAADEVHLAGRLLSVSALDPGSYRVDVMVEVAGREDRPYPDRVTGLTLQAQGVTPLEFVRPPFPERRLQVGAAVTVDCGAVAAGRLPAGGEVVLTVTAGSGVPHDQRLPVSDDQLREAVLVACDLPDPEAETVVEASGASGGLLVSLQQVPRRPDGLVLESIAVEGFEVVLDGLALPYRLPPRTGLGLFVTVRVRDCAAALAGGLRVRVTLTEGGVRTVREADPPVSQPQPGAVPAAQHLQQLVDAGCR